MTNQPGQVTWVTRSPSPIVHVPVSTEPTISFVLVTYGTGTVVVAAIASLVESLAGTGVEADVVVVDNRHPEFPWRTAVHLLLDTAGVTVIRPERNLGFGGGCNAGVRHARAATLAFVNPDVQFAPGWIQPLVDALATRDAAIAAPVLLEPDRRVQSAGHQLLADGFTTPIRSSPGRGGVGRPDYASAACWLVRRAVFEELGGFDESFFPAYYEDVDLALRARPRGGTVVVGDSMVVHRRGASTAATEVPDTTAQRLRLLEKWPALATRPGTGRS